MFAIKRLKQYESEPIDHVVNMIKRREIKPGRYSHLVKIDKTKDYSKRKELFTNGQS